MCRVLVLFCWGCGLTRVRGRTIKRMWWLVVGGWTEPLETRYTHNLQITQKAVRERSKGRDGRTLMMSSTRMIISAASAAEISTCRSLAWAMPWWVEGRFEEERGRDGGTEAGRLILLLPPPPHTYIYTHQHACLQLALDQSHTHTYIHQHASTYYACTPSSHLELALDQSITHTHIYIRTHNVLCTPAAAPGACS